MLTPLRHRAYRHLFLAQIVALVGTGLATVALSLVAYRLAGANAGSVLGTAFAIKMVAYVAVAPLAGAVLARLPRRAVMVGADLVRLAVALCLPFVGEIWQVYVLIFVLQSSSAVFTPTFQSTIPLVLTDEEDYTSALSLSRLAYDLEAVLSPMLAAALLLVIPSSALFFGTAIGFAGSAVLVVSVTLPRRTPTTEPVGGFRARVLRGARVLLSARPLRAVLALNLVVASAGAFVLVLTVVIVQNHFAFGENLVPIALAINGLGSMIAAFSLPRLLRRVPERAVMVTGAIALPVTLVVTAGLLTSTSPWTFAGICLAWLVIGLGWSAVETPVGRLIRRHVRDEDLDSAFAAQFSLSHACWLITYPLAGWLGNWSLTGTATVLAVIGAGALLLAIRTWAPRKRTENAGTERPVVSA